MDWRLADAKNRFSELVARALSEGPQRVYRGHDVVVIMAERDYEELVGKRLSFKKFLTGKGPSLAGLDLTRDKSPIHDLKL